MSSPETLPESLRVRLIEALADVYSTPTTLQIPFADAGLSEHLAHIDLVGPMAEVCARVEDHLAQHGCLEGFLDEVAREHAAHPSLPAVIDAVREELLPRLEARTDRPPFPGLVSYEEDDATLFHGRRREVAASLGRLAEHRVLWVTGASGSGKSSLIRAGIVPALRRRAEGAGERLLVIDVRTNDDPLGELARSLQNKTDGEPTARLAWNDAMTARFRPGAEPEALVNVLTTLLSEAKTRVVLVVDQLEAVATVRAERANVRELFLAMVAACGRCARERRDGAARLRVILGVRSDLLGEILVHDETDALYRQTPRQVVGVLAPEAIKDVVHAPIAGRAEVEEEFSTAIAADVGNDPGRLPLLNLVLRQVWDAYERGVASGPRRISTALYDAAGGLQGALGKAGDQVLEATKGTDQAVLNRVLLALVDVEEGRQLRRVVAYETLQEETRCDDAQLTRVLNALGGRYLVRMDGEGGRRTVEVAHEALYSGWKHYARLLRERGPMLALAREVESATSQWKKRGEGELWPDGTKLHEAEAGRDAGTLDLSEDARRFLTASRAELARRQRFERRVRKAEWGAAISSVAVVLALTLLFVRAQRERRRAEGHLQRAEGLVEFMLRAQEGPLREVGRLDVLEASVRKVQEYYDKLDQAGEADTAHAQRMRSVALDHLGDVQVALGDLAGALVSYRRSKGIRDLFTRRNPNDTQWLCDLSVSLNKIGDVQIAQGDLASALASHRGSKDIFDRLTHRDPNNTQWLRDLSVSQDRIGDVLLARGDLAGALASYRESKGIRDRLTRRHPNDTQWLHDLSVSQEKIGDMQLAQGDLANALASYRESQDIRDRLTRRDPNNTQWLRDLSVSQEKIGDVHLERGDLAGALASYRESRDIVDRLTRRDPNNTQWLHDLSVNLNKIGDLQVTQGDLAGALASYRESKDIADRLTHRDPNNTQWLRDLSVSQEGIGDVQIALGDLAGALASYRESKDNVDRLTRRDPNNTQWLRDLSVSLGRVGDLYRALGEFTQARGAYEQALAGVRPLATRPSAAVDLISDVAYYTMRVARVRAFEPNGRLPALEFAREARDTLRSLHDQHRLTAEQEPWLADAQSFLASLEASTDAQLAQLRPLVLTGAASSSTLHGLSARAVCRAILTPPPAPTGMCQVTVLYGDNQAIYGPPGTFPCRVTRAPLLHIAGGDNATDDGDGTLTLDTRAASLTVTDIARGTHPAFRVEIRLTNRAPTAR